MNKVIAFSLWGSNPKYTIGALKNAALARTIYPDWLCEFHVGDDVPFHIIDALKTEENVKLLYYQNTENNWKSMFWRFHSGYNYDITIFRDTDSRLNYREKAAVDQWLNSDKTFHIMRDHPYHQYKILGGMWGFKNNNQYDLKTILSQFTPSDRYGTDYQFFEQVLYPLIGNDKIVHDPFYDKIDFPTPRVNREFVGDVFDQFDNRDPNFYRMIKEDI